MTAPLPIRSELAARILSGGILALAACAALYFGGPAFSFLCAAVGGIMVWETSRLSDSRIPQPAAAGLGICAAATVAAASIPAANIVHPAVQQIAAPAAGIVLLRSGRIRFFVFSFLILLSVRILDSVENELGAGAALWIVITVAATDVAGYFAGRKFGGPKLAPKLSPNKTWSGAAAGWTCAALIGLIFQSAVPHASAFAGFLIAVAAQAGDLGESWLKRTAGAKDSSSLLPGHGGFCDRFDGMAGGCLGFYAFYEFRTLAGGGTGALL